MGVVAMSEKSIVVLKLSQTGHLTATFILLKTSNTHDQRTKQNKHVSYSRHEKRREISPYLKRETATVQIRLYKESQILANVLYGCSLVKNIS